MTFGTMHFHFLCLIQNQHCVTVSESSEKNVWNVFLCLCVPTRKKCVFFCNVVNGYADRASLVWDTARRMFIGVEGLREKHRSTTL